MQVYETPFVMHHLEAMLSAASHGRLPSPSSSSSAAGAPQPQQHSDSEVVCSFVTCLLLADTLSVTARTDAVVADVVTSAERMQGRGEQGGDAASQLVDTFAALAGAGTDIPPALVAHWPGGRHSNDKPNFTDISIMPCGDELAADVRAAFLPLADGSDGFLRNQVHRPLCNCKQCANRASDYGPCHTTARLLCTSS